MNFKTLIGAMALMDEVLDKRLPALTADALADHSERP